MLEKDLQQQLDIQKWVESEKHCEDMCHRMPYCVFCKGEKENPCAKAYNRQAEAKKVEVKTAEAKKVEVKAAPVVAKAEVKAAPVVAKAEAKAPIKKASAKKAAKK